MFRELVPDFIDTQKIRAANFVKHTTRIFAVKIRVANFEKHTTRIFAVELELQILKCKAWLKPARFIHITL